MKHPSQGAGVPVVALGYLPEFPKGAAAVVPPTAVGEEGEGDEEGEGVEELFHGGTGRV